MAESPAPSVLHYAAIDWDRPLAPARPGTAPPHHPDD